MKKKFIVVIFLLTILVLTASALELPENIKKISEYNRVYASDFLKKISIPIAFIAGLISFIAPCTLALFPAFFSYTFKEKKEITKMSIIFFLGFALAFVVMGVIAGIFGLTALNLIPNKGMLVIIAGLFLVFLGIMSLFGKGFSSFIKQGKFSHDSAGIFLFGVFFAVGWTACTGPILAGVLSIAAIIGNLFYSGLLLFVYALGIATPFFIFSIFYDKLNLAKSPLIAGKEFEFKIFGKRLRIHSTNLIAGLLLILLGLIFILFQGTEIINTLDPFDAVEKFSEWQRVLIK